MRSITALVGLGFLAGCLGGPLPSIPELERRYSSYATFYSDNNCQDRIPDLPGYNYGNPGCFNVGQVPGSVYLPSPSTDKTITLNAYLDGCPGTPSDSWTYQVGPLYQPPVDCTTLDGALVTTFNIVID